jgi:O-antigen/teichoic acid export membrane protein
MSRLRALSSGMAIYGAGEVAIQALNFLLLPLYVVYLTKADYGILALLAGIEAPAKLFFRWGLDGAFMRYWYDCDDEPSRQRLASTLLLFMLAVNGVLLVVALAAAPFIVDHLMGGATVVTALQLVLLNTFAIGFTFVPFHVLRMENRAREFTVLAFGRSLATLLLRLLFVVGLGWGVMGIVVTDVLVTVAVLAVLLPWFRRLARPVFSRPLLRQSLSFGLPRLPHGLALQAMAVSDRFILGKFRSVEEVGLYSMGVTFGLVPKIALAAFETAWAPFYYATSRQPDAPKVFALVATYGVAALAIMTAVTAAVAADLLAFMTRGYFTAAAPVVGWTAVGVFFYGVYLLTSIGLNITSHTRYYPVATGVAAAVTIGLNFALVPRYGIVGAAGANATAYAIQSAIAFRLAQRFYPIPYAYGRIARAIVAAAAGYLAATLLPEIHPLAGALARAATVAGVALAMLAATGFIMPDEWRRLTTMFRLAKRARGVTPGAEATEMAGEIVTVDVREGLIEPPDRKERP